jgi:hypothetical protein
MLPNWQAIIIHHSATIDDDFNSDWEAIRKFHKSWRFNGEIISQSRAQELIELDQEVISPWQDIGYHFGLESIKGKLTIQPGRSIDLIGAHCKGMNDKALGICCIGDFDNERPSDAIYYNCAQLCINLMKQFSAITPATILPHNKFSYKTCPGIFFDMERLKKYIHIYIDTNGNID